MHLLSTIQWDSLTLFKKSNFPHWVKISTWSTLMKRSCKIRSYTNRCFIGLILFAAHGASMTTTTKCICGRSPGRHFNPDIIRTRLSYLDAKVCTTYLKLCIDLNVSLQLQFLRIYFIGKMFFCGIGHHCCCLYTVQLYSHAWLVMSISIHIQVLSDTAPLNPWRAIYRALLWFLVIIVAGFSPYLAKQNLVVLVFVK